MTPREMLKILKADGWVEKSQTGSHKQLVHPTKSGKVTVPIHSGDLNIVTVKSIKAQAKLK